jgi:hypothetical protein
MMPRWYVDDDTKPRLDLFNTKLSAELDIPTMSQERLMQLLMKHKDAILDVIVAAETAVTNNSKSLDQVVPA